MFTVLKYEGWLWPFWFVAVLDVIRVYAAANQKRVTALVGLDMSAAFDTIDHDVLLERLDHRFGVRDAALLGFVHT